MSNERDTLSTTRLTGRVRLSESRSEAGHHTAVSATHMERDLKHVFKTTDADKEAHPRFRIHIHSKRKRLADPDGIYTKAAIDGLVVGCVLLGDSHRYVESVTASQEQSDREETIITIESD